MEKADESVCACVCVRVPFIAMFVGLCRYVSIRGVSEASMSATKPQNAPKMLLFCKSVYVRGLVCVF